MATSARPSATPGCRGIAKRDDAGAMRWHVAMRPGKRRRLEKTRRSHALVDRIERAKARIRAKVDHSFGVTKRQFGFTKVRYRRLAKNTAQLETLFMLSNLWMVRRRWT